MFGLTLFKAFDMDKYLYNTSPDKMFENLKYNKTEESGESETTTWKSESWQSEDGKVKYFKKVIDYTPKKKEISVDDLKLQLDEAIKTEKFEEAIKLRDQIKKLKGE